MSIGDTHKARSDGHLTTLLPQAARQIGELAREELQLARAEFAANRRHVGFGGGLFGAAGLMGFVAVQAIAVAVIAGLAAAMPVWLAALLVGVAAALGAAAMALLGKKQVARAVPAVEEVVDSVKADVAAVKDSGR